ncbi:MAG: amino acid adenylation domain-containing protein, partial [Planctomycetota bacterium]
RLWFINQLEPDTALHNLPAAFRLKGQLDASRLQRSISEIIRRHDVLRTVFPVHMGNPVQVVKPAYEADIPCKRLPSSLGVLQSYLAEQTRIPFSLQEGPLFRAELIELDSDDHVLFLNAHHIIWDGWSFDVFLAELAAIYEAFAQGIPCPLPELPVQYVDYSTWQREWLEAGELEHQLEYWRKTLSGDLTPLQLSTDHPRPPVRSIEGSRVIRNASPDLVEPLKALAKQEGATLYMALLAAYKVLIHRLTGQQDVLVGTPMASNASSETEGMIGFFVNTIVLRSELAGSDSFRETLRGVRDTCLSAFDHQDAPFEKLVEHLQVPRDRSRTPIHQTEFGFQEVTKRTLGIGSAELEEILIDQDVAGTDLMFWIKFDGTGLPLAMNYSTRLYEKSTIEDLLRTYENLLHACVSSPDTPVCDLTLLDDRQRGALQALGRGEHIPQDAPLCIHQLIGRQTEQTPDATAVIHHDRAVSYGELDRRANQLANELVSLGVVPDALVGICLDRSPRMLVSLLAVHKAGAAYLPLDPTYPQERLHYMLDDSAARIIITERKFQSLFEGCDATPLYLDELEPELTSRSSHRPATRVCSDDLAYVIYTSGSTGRPKGVMIEHRSASNFLLGTARAIEMTNPGVWLAVTSISFDISVLELFGTLAHGFTVVLYDGFHGDGLREEESIPALIDRHHVTHLQCTPSQASMLVSDPAARGAFRSLSHLLVGGEALPAPLAEELQALCSGSVFNMYGPTESTVWSTFHELGQEDGSVPIGQALANQQVYLLDENRRMVPRGAVGELYISGRGLARGYLGREELTAEKFVPDPFAEDSAQRMYRTGDLARFRHDGSLDFLGRGDGQVKLRGHRIELGEIESALASQAGVRSAAVIVREDQPGDQRLTAYCVLSQGAEFDARSLREGLRAFLPAYMVPAAFVGLESLPLTPNGKIDRKALPAPEGSVEARPARREPANDREREILALWQEVLGIDDIGVEEDFFELGGHSLLLPRLLAMLREKTGLQVNYGQLYDHTTIAGLAQALDDSTDEHAPITRLPESADLCLTSAQRRLWFLSRLTPDTGVYNVWQALRLEGNVDPDLLERAIAHLVQRHDVLRTSFGSDETGQPFPIVQDKLSFDLHRLDLPEAQAREYLATKLQAPFDLETAPLFRCELIEVGPAEHIFAIALHHSITDARSLGIFKQELFNTYA